MMDEGRKTRNESRWRKNETTEAISINNASPKALGNVIRSWGCFITVSFLLSGCLVSPNGYLRLRSSSQAHWVARADSGWPGGSKVDVKSCGGPEGLFPVELSYVFKKTGQWLWPEAEFLLTFDQPLKLSDFNAVRLRLRGARGEEIYAVFNTRDKATGKIKPSVCRLRTGGINEEFILPFSEFQVSSDWTVRNPGYHRRIEWGDVESFGLHKKGPDGAGGIIFVDEVEFLSRSRVKPYDIESARFSVPRHYFFGLRHALSGKEGKPGINILDITEAQGSEKQISPFLYGVNLASWLDFPDKEKVRELKPGLLRLGGPFVDRLDWQSGIYSFPGSSVSLKMFGLDEFLGYCRLVNAEPLLQVNALGAGGSEAAALLRHLNQQRGYAVRFFEIGNEPFIWHQVHQDLVRNPVSVREYFERFRDISLAIRDMQAETVSGGGFSSVNTGIKIFAPAISTSWNGWHSCSGQQWDISAVEEFLLMCAEYNNNRPQTKGLLDVLSLHLFNSFSEGARKPGAQGMSEVLVSSANWWDKGYVNELDRAFPKGEIPAVLPRFKGWIDNIAPGLEFAVTEFNLESDSMVKYDMLLKVLYLADLYGIMAEQGVSYSAQFCLNSSDENIALLDDTGKRTALFYPFMLYANYFSGIPLECRVDASPGITAHAVRKDDVYTLMVINKTPRQYSTRVDFSGGPLDIGFRHEFPALSLSCLRINRARNDKIEVWEYGRAQVN